MRCVPINNNPNFRAIEQRATQNLRPKGFSQLFYKGSVSHIDTRISPKDNAVKVKVAMLPVGIFVGVRKETALGQGIPLSNLGPLTVKIQPSSVEFVGQIVENTPAGLRTVDSMLALVP